MASQHDLPCKCKEPSSHEHAGPMSQQQAQRNATFAISERIAFAHQLEGSPQAQELDYRDKVDETGDGSPHAELAAARDRLHDFVVQRLRELQILTHWPLARPVRTPMQIARQLDNLDLDLKASPWCLLGEHGADALELPELPDLLRKDLWGHMELLLAMAGQLGKDGSGASAAGCPSGSTQPAARGGSSGLSWTLGLVTFLPALRTLQAPTLTWLRGFFGDLRPQHRHVGVDDRQHAWFKELKLHAARAVLKEGSAQMCRSFLRFGTPHGPRAPLWEAALCLPPLRRQDVGTFAGLCASAYAQQSLLDVSICDDVRGIADSEQFFLFEEMLRPVLLALSRDWRVPLHTSVELHPSIVGVASAVSGAAAAAAGVSTTTLSSSQLPLPCSMLFVQGLAALAAPLCYMYEHPAAVFRMFRSMYARYWCKLHSLAPLPCPSPALPLLIKTYEQLMQELDPEVVSHVHDVGLPIAALALPWVCSAFAGHLPLEELLLLWDRVLGLDSLLPLPLLAVAVVCFRRQAILACQSTVEIQEVMSDISQLQAIPLLQSVLFHA